MRIDYWLADAQTGILREPIDLGRASWSLTVGDSSLSTIKNRQVGKDEVKDVDVPWSAIPGNTQQDRWHAIEPQRRAIVAFARTSGDIRAGSIGTPFLYGVISGLSCDWTSVTITVSSVYSLLADRYCVPEGGYGEQRARGVLSWSGMTYRGIASEVGWQCTDAKPGGLLPVDWQYRGERHTRIDGEDATLHTRTYQAWNVANLSGKDILDKIAGLSDGPDMQWRPYLTADGTRVRTRFLAGSDTDPSLPQPAVPPYWSVMPRGGTLENVSVEWAMSYQRVYATGSGQDAETLTSLAEDMGMPGAVPGYVMRETSYSDTDADQYDALRSASRARLDAQSRPIMQMSGEYDLDDPGTPQLGSVWPGMRCVVDMQGHPCLPDGEYDMTLMEMSGDGGSRVKVLFDVATVPWYQGIR
ncbi:hypothetical protein ACLUWO_04305 [Pseudoscardovia radai]|uniref:hypothetical protein n=1 Tax=Pseudoscardovia radai TaxID=987066 RepID=UPI0039956FCB